MASVQKTKSGYSVHFSDHEKRRRQLRLGNVSKAQASTVAIHVARIVAAKTMNDTPDMKTVQWLAGIGDDLAEKLQTAGLHTRALSVSLIDFVDQFIIDGRTQDHRPAAVNTVKKWKQARTVLSEFFGTRSVRSITANDAAEFRRWLDTQDRSEAGKRTHIAVIKTLFNAAMNRGLVDANPFSGQKASITPNPERAFYVSRETALRVMEQCPDNQWRLMFALWRFAGLRKMEIFNLTWSDILWDKDRMIVKCPKTEHHDGRSVRHVPIGDVRHWLEMAFNEATEGTESVITRFSPSNVNLQKPLCTIIERAGLTPWPRLIQNLRASCETDWLTRGLPAHVVARWIGHSVRIQNDHYATVEDFHFHKFNATQDVTFTHSVSGVVTPVVTAGSELMGNAGILNSTTDQQETTFRVISSYFPPLQESECLGRGSNLQPSPSEGDALSN